MYREARRKHLTAMWLTIQIRRSEDNVLDPRPFVDECRNVRRSNSDEMESSKFRSKYENDH
jgi:hypothetical protein